MHPIQTQEIAVFPIPGQVTLPNAVVPLHVFEPRYRQMFQESIDAKRRIGVANTLRELPNTRGIETFEPHRVFSAGLAQLIETLPDGRMIVQIENDGRFEAIEDLQEEPYRIAKCVPYVDEPESPGEATTLRTELNEMLKNLPVPNVDKLREHLKSVAWTTQSDMDYSFSIYRLVIFEPTVLQRVLELKSTVERIGFLKDALTNPMSQ
jgi:Lon protease-like protein